MKHIFLNLKRFDIPRALGGVNEIAPVRSWGSYIVEQTQAALSKYAGEDVEFMVYMPEAHLIPAIEALDCNTVLKLGCQGVFREDTSVGGGFGAFTSNRTANAMKAMGCSGVLIGHCEERKDKAGVMAEVGSVDAGAVNRILNQEIKRTLEAGLSVLYCIGETENEQAEWERILKDQIETGLSGIDTGTAPITIAYEPVWAIGPGKVLPDEAYIAKIGEYVKEITGGMDVVYGGGLKRDNAAMLAGIPSMDGGLIALTRFQGEIGFYPEEYIEIIRIYLGH